MRVLVTGSSGKIGRVVAERVHEAGHDVVEFDLVRGEDIRDAGAVAEAAAGCAAAIHLAAIVDSVAPAAEIFETNVRGTWNVLSAGLRRVVFFSSVNALGTFQGLSDPDYLPIDDEHPARPVHDYGISKLLGEELCAAFTRATGMTTVCLRPPAVWADDDRARAQARRAADPESESTPFWEYGAYVDVRDAAEAALLALTRPSEGHVRVLLCADEISASRPGRELAAELLPHVPWRGGEEYEREPWRALVDTARARDLLGWRPRS